MGSHIYSYIDRNTKPYRWMVAFPILIAMNGKIKLHACICNLSAAVEMLFYQ